MRIIGDVHGKFDLYLKIAKDAALSFQIGDFGFQQTWTALSYSDLNPNDHKVGQGNHDPHDTLKNYQHFTGRYGPLSIGQYSPFWIGGALSIDLVYRVAQWIEYNRDPKAKTWWAEEQLTLEEMQDCTDKYMHNKPELVISHTAPMSIIGRFNDMRPGNIMDQYGWGHNYYDKTSQYLETLYQVHKPKMWIFGHFHKSYEETINGTKFICLSELEHLDI